MSYKTLIMLIASCLLFVGIGTYAYNYDKKFPYDNIAGENNQILNDTPDTVMGDILKKDVINEGNTEGESYIDDFLKVFGIDKFIKDDYNVGSNQAGQPGAEAPANRYIIRIINYSIMALGLIATIFIIYGFFMMFFSKEDSSYEKARTIVFNAFIAIVIIGLSRAITTFIVYIFFNRVDGGTSQTASIEYQNISIIQTDKII